MDGLLPRNFRLFWRIASRPSFLLEAFLFIRGYLVFYMFCPPPVCSWVPRVWVTWLEALRRCAYIQRLMRGVGALFMFSSLGRASRISAFCKSPPTCPSSSSPASKLRMSTSSRVLLDRVAGDGLGGSGTTLVPKVADCFSALVYVCNFLVCPVSAHDCWQWKTQSARCDVAAQPVLPTYQCCVFSLHFSLAPINSEDSLYLV